MPVYLNRCTNCQHEFESIQKYQDKPLKRCPNCRRHKLERVIFTPTVICYGNIDTVTTFGQAAELNAKRMGKEGMSNLEQKTRKKQKLKLPRGAQRIDSASGGGRPWWRDGDKPLNLNKVKDPHKYVMTGDKN